MGKRYNPNTFRLNDSRLSLEEIRVLEMRTLGIDLEDAKLASKALTDARYTPLEQALARARIVAEDAQAVVAVLCRAVEQERAT